MIVELRIAAVLLLTGALGSLPPPALAQATSTAHGTSTTTHTGLSVVTGNIRSINAGVITLISGTSVFITEKTKLPNGPPTLLSRIRVTGTRAAQGNINAAKIEILK